MPLSTQRLGSAIGRMAKTVPWSVRLSSSYGVDPRTLLQDWMERAFAREQGAAEVVGVENGRGLAAHNVQVLSRRVASPGSAITPFVLALLLETGAIGPQDSIARRRTLTISGRRLNRSHPPQFSTFKAEEALALSCNPYFVTAAEPIKPGELERRLMELGLNRPSGLLPDVGQGRVATAKSLAERQRLAVEVAGIEMTPLELATAYLQLARLDPSTATAAEKIVLAGQRESTHYGLTGKAKPDKRSVAGKTGTATDSSDPHTPRWFAGFTPAEKPELVVAVFVDRGRGSIEAANIARSIFQAYAEQRK